MRVTQYRQDSATAWNATDGCYCYTIHPRRSWQHGLSLRLQCPQESINDDRNQTAPTFTAGQTYRAPFPIITADVTQQRYATAPRMYISYCLSRTAIECLHYSSRHVTPYHSLSDNDLYMYILDNDHTGGAIVLFPTTLPDLQTIQLRR